MAEIQDAVIRHAMNDMIAVPTASHDPPRLTAVEAAKEVVWDMLVGVGEAFDKMAVLGRDEAANALFNGNAYWPGEHPTPLSETPELPDYDRMLTASRGGIEVERGIER